MERVRRSADLLGQVAKSTDSGIVTNGGRVLGVTGFGAYLRQAQATAYRKDIAEKAFI